VVTVPLTGECRLRPHEISSVTGDVIVFENNMLPSDSFTDEAPSVVILPLTGFPFASTVMLDTRFLLLSQTATLPSAKVIVPFVTLVDELPTPPDKVLTRVFVPSI
jgi:hypothetical protein